MSSNATNSRYTTIRMSRTSPGYYGTNITGLAITRCKAYWAAFGPAQALIQTSTRSCPEAFVHYHHMSLRQAEESCKQTCYEKAHNLVKIWSKVATGSALIAACIQLLLLILIIAECCHSDQVRQDLQDRGYLDHG